MTDPSTTEHPVPCPLPRVTIQFCTQCKWLLRAAYVRPHPLLPLSPTTTVPYMYLEHTSDVTPPAVRTRTPLHILRLPRRSSTTAIYRRDLCSCHPSW